jgi:hypothetical protein
MYDRLFKLAEFLDEHGLFFEADVIDEFLNKAAKEKWMQKAVNPKEKGELREKMKTPKGEKIPISELEAKKKRLQEKGKGDKKLSEKDRETLSQIQFALNARRSKANDQVV